jgi:hypothetical protein
MKRVAEAQLTKSSEAGAAGAPLPLLTMAEMCLKACAGPIAKAGDSELHEAVVAVLRLLGGRRKIRTGDEDA